MYVLTLPMPANVSITPTDSARNLGVILDSSFTMLDHISSIFKSCFLSIYRYAVATKTSSVKQHINIVRSNCTNCEVGNRLSYQRTANERVSHAYRNRRDWKHWTFLIACLTHMFGGVLARHRAAHQLIHCHLYHYWHNYDV